VCCDRVLFCAKETVYKAWFPLTHHRLGFQEPTSPLTPDDRPYRRLLLCSSAGGRTDDRRRTAHRVRRLLADHRRSADHRSRRLANPIASPHRCRLRSAGITCRVFVIQTQALPALPPRRAHPGGHPGELRAPAPRSTRRSRRHGARRTASGRRGRPGSSGAKPFALDRSSIPTLRPDKLTILAARTRPAGARNLARHPSPSRRNRG
jgi:hypothetical protein